MSNGNEVTNEPGDDDTNAGQEPSALANVALADEAADTIDTAAEGHNDFDESEDTRAEQPRFAVAELEAGVVEAGVVEAGVVEAGVVEAGVVEAGVEASED